MVQFESPTAFLWCMGAEYDYAPPPVFEFGFTLQFPSECVLLILNQ